MIDKIQEIHLRHERAHMAPSDWWTVTGADAHQDRAFLLNKVWEMREVLLTQKTETIRLTRELEEARNDLQFHKERAENFECRLRSAIAVLEG